MNVPAGICGRLRDVRLKAYGPRGKARFAKELGIRASTYQQYEVSRVPPVDLLVRMAQLTQCDLVWLLTGEPAHSADASSTVAADPPIVRRVRDLVRRRPETVQGLSAFVTLIDPKPPESVGHTRVAGAERTPLSAAAGTEMVPVVGSTAAGPARFWKEMIDLRQDAADVGNAFDKRLDRLLGQLSEPDARAEGRLSLSGSDRSSSTAALIQFSQPDERGIVEFLLCPKTSLPETRLIAWRIDGESMAPRYRDGDFVLVDPREPAVEGHPCVAHQRGQIGVNCKIFQRDGGEIVLIPVNEQFPTQRYPAENLAWAHRVRFSVRLVS